MLFEGVLSAAEKENQHLVVFRGGQLGKDPGSAIYDLVNERYHGVVTWASSDGSPYINNYYKRYGSVPVVTLTLQIPPYPVVSTDSYAGVRAVVEHLIQHHGKRRIAFIRGPESHASAKERYQAYLDALKENGIAVDDNLISPFGTWDKSKGTEMVQLFLDQRKLTPGSDFDAIACVSDNIAVGAIEELQKRGIRVPDDLAVTGCNDTFEARALTPPVTTVSLPGDDQIAKAIEVVNAAAAGRAPAPVTKLPAKIVMGQSCGCLSHKMEAAAAGGKGGLLGFSGLFSRDRTARAMVDSITGSLNAAQLKEEVLLDCAGKLIDAFHKESGWGSNHGAFMAALGDAVKRFAADKLPVELLQNYVSALRRHVLPGLRRRSRIIKAEDLWAQGRVMISEAAGRLRDAANLKAVARERAISALGAKLVTTYETEAIRKILQDDLPKLGIPAMYLALYENEPGWDRKSVPSQLRVLTSFNTKNSIRFDTGRGLIPTRDFIPELLASASERQSMMALPLHFNDIQIGLVVFGVGPRDGSIYEAIKVQLSSALYGALLRQTLKGTLDTMESKVTEVSGNSEKINTSVQGGSSAMEGVANSIRDISQSIREVMQVIDDAVTLTETAGRDINNLNNQSSEISKILGFITEIAQQTNLLSLNAAIEAARAGEAGRGFAVVAQEVKTLAVNTVTSSANISTMIGSVQENTRQVFSSVTAISDIMRKVSALSASISSAVSEQETSTNEISCVLTEAARGTGQIAEVLAELDAISKAASEI
ncbi:MAG: methyl-accepting chemotaxis protein [Moraxellaceae bacterium]|nr:methyl-accepting chemotaxis protein [Moraxellaceae bacterium]